MLSNILQITFGFLAIRLQSSTLKVDFVNFVHCINFMLEMDEQQSPEHKNVVFFCCYIDFQGHIMDKGQKGQNRKFKYF